MTQSTSPSPSAVPRPQEKGGTSQSKATSLLQVLVVVAAMALVFVVAHATTVVTFSLGGRFGKVVELNPLDPKNYDGEGLKADPTLIVVGNSQQFLLPGAQRNESPRLREGGDMILDELARGIDERYPQRREGNFVRFSTTWFMPIEMVATLGTWIERMPQRPVHVLIAANVFDHDATQSVRPRVAELLRAYPENTQALLARLRAMEGGAATADALAKAVEASAKKRVLPKDADEAEGDVRRWLERHEALEGSAFVKGRLAMKYQKVEAPFLQVAFGRVEQPGRDIDPKALLTEGTHEHLQVLVRMLVARGIRPVCYAMPWNPFALPPSARTDALVDKMGQSLTSAGCVFIDAAKAVPASAEYWGFWGGTPDFDHLTPAGIRLFSKFLLARMEDSAVWRPLTRSKDNRSGALP